MAVPITCKASLLVKWRLVSPNGYHNFRQNDYTDHVFLRGERDLCNLHTEHGGGRDQQFDVIERHCAFEMT